MKNKTITADEAIALMSDNDVVTTTGFVQSCIPEALHAALERRFVDTGSPKNLTLIMAAGAGDSKGLGTGRFHHPGLLKRVIAANFGRMPKVAQAVQDNIIQGYNLPQGVISQLYRACAAGQPGLFSKVGLHTYVDPRCGGGRTNDVTTEDIVKLVEVDGDEWLFYKATNIDIAFIRGTSADASGNISMEKEALTLDSLAQAMAARNNGGIVIAQVERIVEQGSFKPKDIKIPGILVDCVVVADPANEHRMNYGTTYNPALSGEVRVPVEAMSKMPLGERKIIARRAAFELPPNGIINLGVGVPEGIAAVANEEKVTPYITLTTEAGAIGGVLAQGASFGSAINADAIIDQNQQFDFYDGGGLDLACLGMAECDEHGNVNTSRFGGRLNGCGGFINISQNARQVVFGGTFTAGGLKTAISIGELKILQEGSAHKFVKNVEQITFSGEYAKTRSQNVLYITERCVFHLTPEGLELKEIAPGISVDRDILPNMGFVPIINNPVQMDRRIFREEVMNLLSDIINLNIDERVSYDQFRNILFLNLEGLNIQAKKEITALRRVLIDSCHKVGKRVNSVINYDGFTIADNLCDAFAELVQYMMVHHYDTNSRYTTSAFLRLKMESALNKRGVSPHIFERKVDALAYVDKLSSYQGA